MSDEHNIFFRNPGDGNYERDFVKRFLFPAISGQRPHLVPNFMPEGRFIYTVCRFAEIFESEAHFIRAPPPPPLQEWAIFSYTCITKHA
jgi:hypothetical protein